MTNYKNILETLLVIKSKNKSKQYLEIINVICNLLNEEEELRFVSASYSRDFKTEHLLIKVRYNGKVLA